MIEQRTTDWYNQRLFKFTASEYYKLMTSGRGGEMFGATAMGYIMDKVAEIITDGKILDYKKIDAKSLEWGNLYEDHAKLEYFLKTGRRVEPAGFESYDDLLGASPDGFVGDDGLVEVKCPFDTVHHIENLQLKSQSDFVKLRYPYFIQIQIQLLSTKRKWCDFVSYDPRCSQVLNLKVLRILPDPDVIREILKRYDAAKKILDGIILDLSKNISTQVLTTTIAA